MNRGRKIKRIGFYILIGVAAPFMLLGLRIFLDLSNPLRQPVEQIREDILLVTPLGISIGDTAEILQVARESKNWGYFSVSTGRGVVYAELGLPSRAEDFALNRSTVVGEHSIRMHLGGYTNLFRTNIIIWWAFDENFKLIEVYVRKRLIGW